MLVWHSKDSQIQVLTGAHFLRVEQGGGDVVVPNHCMRGGATILNVEETNKFLDIIQKIPKVFTSPPQ